ncbi:GNAT family N-acetyltransferase [Candidatus Izemoplasma sp. B36]|uniref:GNAT family N-acetyltransferase n=1 Tax=Candidatus Izemoplasma sp. B36 TaxID=3242468 RepID=UPI003557288C
MNIKIRPEEPGDYNLVEEITKEAFTRDDYDCNEHIIVNKLRNASECIKELSYVLELDNQVIGHIIYSKCIIQGNENFDVITFGPVSIKKAYQRKGFGSKLISFTINKARELGYNGIVIYGHPEYYPRFGFENAEKYSISTKEGKNGDYFMALELYPGGLNAVEGRLYQSDIFDTNE